MKALTVACIEIHYPMSNHVIMVIVANYCKMFRIVKKKKNSMGKTLSCNFKVNFFVLESISLYLVLKDVSP